MGLDVRVDRAGYVHRVGPYSLFHDFRHTVAQDLEHGEWGSRFPLLQNHSDCDGDYALKVVPAFQAELETIRRELAQVAYPALLACRADGAETVAWVGSNTVPLISSQQADVYCTREGVLIRTGDLMLRYVRLWRESAATMGITRGGRTERIPAQVQDTVATLFEVLDEPDVTLRHGTIPADTVFGDVIAALLGACKAALRSRGRIVYC